MDETFDEMSKKGKNGVDSIVAWMQEATIIDKSKEAEDKAKKMFSNVKDQGNVTADEFKTVVTALATEQQSTFEQLSKKLVEQGPKILQAFGAAASAFKESLN